MRLASHSPRGEAGHPITTPRHCGLCCEPGRPSFDTPAEEFRVIDSVSQKEVAADQQQLDEVMEDAEAALEAVFAKFENNPSERRTG